MDAGAARTILSRYSHIEDATDQYTAKQPWHRRYVAWKFKPTVLPPGDLATPHLKRANDLGFPATLEIYASKIGSREVVSGLSYRTYGSLIENRLGPPTAAFPVKSNGNLIPGFAYVEDRGFADQKHLEIMDNCNGPPPLSGHFGGESPPSCRNESLPRGAFLHGRAYPNGVLILHLRDADIGQQHLSSTEGNAR